MCNYRILIVNAQSLYENNATGITLRNMFKSYPNNNIMELFFYGWNIISSNEIKIKSCMASPWSRPFYHIFRNNLGANLASQINYDMMVAEIKEDIISFRRKNKFKNLLSGFLDITPTFYYSDILNKIDEFKPQVIYTMGATSFVLKAALYLSDRYGCRIILHFMDNWRETMYTSSKSLLIYRWMLNYYLRKVEKKMNVGLAISAKMAAHYEKTSGIKYLNLMNTIESSKIKKPTLLKNRELRIVYAGGLHLNRYRSLLDVDECISNLNMNGIKTKLYVYCSDLDIIKYSAQFQKNNTSFLERLPHYRVYEAYDSADILIHIESFDSEQIQFTKYSLSTKISEYLSAGKPIICYAPKALAVYEYINSTEAGYSVSTKQDLLEKITLLANDETLRISMANNGVEIANKFHTIQKGREILIHAINESVS